MAGLVVFAAKLWEDRDDPDMNVLPVVGTTVRVNGCLLHPAEEAASRMSSVLFLRDGEICHPHPPQHLSSLGKTQRWGVWMSISVMFLLPVLEYDHFYLEHADLISFHIKLTHGVT